MPGTAALIALALFFGSGYILELASVIEILIFVAGVILLLIEIFVVPGFGIFGITGIVAIVASLFLGLLSDFEFVNTEMLSVAIYQLAGSLVASLVIIYGLSKVLPKTQMWNRLILQTNIVEKSGYASTLPDLEHLVEKEGDALTDLRPSGTALIENKRYDVVTQGDYIEHGTKIKVISVEGSKVVVTKS